jgi:dipeptide/tripeptide permease
MGLILLSIGSGSIKPYVAGFGADQYLHPNQENQMYRYITYFYLMINLAAMLALWYVPYLKNAFKCICMEHCYPLAFGICSILMILAFFIFFCGTRKYKKGPDPEKIVTQVCRVIFVAIRNKFRMKGIKKNNLVDYAMDDFPIQRIIETKALLRVLLLFLPLPLFWGVFKQMGSTWVLQGERLNGDFGNLYVTSEQMQFFNPLILLIFIPLSKFTLFPLLKSVGIKRSLQFVTTGMVFLGAAFLIAGILELFINLKGEGCLNIFWQVPQYFVLTHAEVCPFGFHHMILLQTTVLP